MIEKTLLNNRCLNEFLFINARLSKVNASGSASDNEMSPWAKTSNNRKTILKTNSKTTPRVPPLEVKSLKKDLNKEL